MNTTVWIKAGMGLALLRVVHLAEAQREEGEFPQETRRIFRSAPEP